MSTSAPAPALPRAAATTLVVRDHDDRLQVLMLRRSTAASFMPGAYVFPGGAVDENDARIAAKAGCTASEAQSAAGWAVGGAGLAAAVAALRECFEESGLWLGADGPVDAQALTAARERLHAGTADLAALAAELGLPLATHVLEPWGHWVTPIDVPKRFDTRFYVALAPQGQAPVADRRETTRWLWVEPGEALVRHARQELPLEFATRNILESLRPHGSARALMAAAAVPRTISPVHPRVARTGAGERRVLLPEDHAYAEVMRLDAAGTGSACCTLEAGTAVQLAQRVWRVTAPNPGVMTGPGTNSYLVGNRDGVVVIDPGPPIDSHIDALLRAAPGPLRAVLVTHTHTDHSPAALPLARRAGVPCVGLPAPAHGRQDPSFAPDHAPADGERYAWAGGALVAIHTPGHASNHVCWWLDDEGLLFTGDHLMQGSTVVIDPPDGNMAAYLASLRALPGRLPGLAWLAPGHGFLIERPVDVIQRLLKHRAAREAKVIAALHQQGPCEAEALVPAVYADTPAHLHPVALRSLLAHLHKLREERRADEAQGRWHPLGDPFDEQRRK